MKARIPWVWAGLLPAIGLLMSGCGQDQRTTSSGAQSVPTFVTVGRGVTPSSPGPGSGTLELKKKISAKDGGTMHLGRFTLVFAKHALIKDTDITIKDLTAATGKVQCQLLPEGTVFIAPVTLEADFSDLSDPSQYSMYWRVPMAVGPDVWMNVGGDETANGAGIITTLQHFSEYAPGKAGW